uniref:Uncharacterized protein n=1 Tax=Anguilla anguilla TaxID=7936 RepID=A0A0E9XGL8_ANGAN
MSRLKGQRVASQTSLAGSYRGEIETNFFLKCKLFQVKMGIESGKVKSDCVGSLS